MDDFNGFGFIGPSSDVSDELVNEVIEDLERKEARFEQRTFTRSDLPKLYENLDKSREVLKMRETVARMVRILDATAKVYARRQKIVIQKIAELEGPITVDSKGAATLPEFKAEDISLEGLNDK